MLAGATTRFKLASLANVSVLFELRGHIVEIFILLILPIPNFKFNN